MESKIRNFVITAHIDHGKSTLADRMLEITETVEKREFRNQFLDQMDLERERGITIKLQPVRMVYRHGESELILNLVDTPGHVDFSYEVSRSLAAVEGAILLVDVTQGIQAQTLANLHLVQQQGLKIIPAVNKVDLAFSKDFLFDLKKKMSELVGCLPEEVLEVSAKTGKGVKELLDAVVEKIPAPEVNDLKQLRALVFDSAFDAYKGAIAYLRVVDGRVDKNDRIKFFATDTEAEALEVGIFKPKLTPTGFLRAGEIGYVATGIKNPGLVKVGDTVLNLKSQNSNLKTEAVKPLPGYKEPQPVVFVNFYPEDASKFDLLELALGKLKLNDASLFFIKEKQEVLGQGFRLGLLGTLHLEVVRERLKREYQLDPVVTIPTVLYKAVLDDGELKNVFSPSDLPPADKLIELQEPWVLGEIITPNSHLSGILNLVQLSRGVAGDISNISETSILINFVAPLSEIIVDFYDKLKSVSQGYASLSYEISDWQKGELVRLDVLVNNEKVDAFSRIVSREKSYTLGKLTVEKLKEILPHEVFPVPLQAAIGSTIIARVTIPASKKKLGNFGKNGGDRTRKMKLWKKQKEGKKRLSQFGKVNLEPSVFFEVFKATK
ncbi:MAG: elongation factor 4 [Candidatus Brennerbacteria bacterium RIFOXYB1_FULL_41_13]|uniref:Elongation factor 4 n=1 Tax=Candidatus Brennerbacteria bacterium RIFOXYD1_FULL_41_16 TaxID=1797529 RepID=A0A1G1XLD7_9BACT|nr:MAG: elongation factor 4 [Candidatus Brennerbacteria bacterium RIFOXYB1_FULL_41_13]OGY40849.1 MAG: elongation factor 4 [Candidatus Brennerbacteria bacterium RIFOXYD1_FULL_41_16]